MRNVPYMSSVRSYKNEEGTNAPPRYEEQRSYDTKKIYKTLKIYIIYPTMHNNIYV